MESLKLTLGSGSPRRREILSSMGLPFSIVVPTTEEKSEEVAASDFCEDIAKQKFYALQKMGHYGDLDIGLCSDTIVCLGDNILGKPRDREDAFEMIRSLSGKTHSVISAICLGPLLAKNSQDILVSSEETKIKFLDLSDQVINRYLDHGSYVDKAGSYGIQEPHCFFASTLEGSYSNVVGLPIELLEVMLSKLSMQRLKDENWKKLF